MLTFIIGHTIPSIVIGQQVHLQHLTQKLAPGINAPQIFRIRMAVQNRYTLLWPWRPYIIRGQWFAALDTIFPSVPNVKGRNLGPLSGGEPYNLVLLEFGWWWRLKEQCTHGIPHLDVAPVLLFSWMLVSALGSAETPKLCGNGRELLCAVFWLVLNRKRTRLLWVLMMHQLSVQETM